MKFIHKLEVDSEDDIIEVNGEVFQLVGFAFPSNVPHRVEFKHIASEEVFKNHNIMPCDYGRIW